MTIIKLISRSFTLAVVLLASLVSGDNEWLIRDEFADKLPATLTPFYQAIANSSVECLLLCEINSTLCDSVAYSQNYHSCKLFSHPNLPAPLPKLAFDPFGHQMYYKKFFCPNGWLKDVPTRTCYYPGSSSLQRPSAWQVCEERLMSVMVTFQTPDQRKNLYTLLIANRPSVTKWWTGYAMFDGALWPRPVEDFPGYVKRRGDCGGNDIISPCPYVSPYECYLLCDRKYRDKCVAFNYNVKTGKCCLKSIGCEQSGLINPVTQGWWFFDKVHQGRPLTFYPASDCSGHDIKRLSDVSRYQCKQLCRQMPHCVAFGYHPNTRDCWVKWQSCMNKGSCSVCELWDVRDINDGGGGVCPYSIRFRDNCIVYHKSQATWPSVDNLCRQMGGKLTRPTDFRRKNPLAYVQKKRFGNYDFFVDYTSIGHSGGNWTTIYDGQTLTNSVYDFFQYNSGEPNGCCGNPSCGGCYGFSSDSNGNYVKFDDYNCNAQMSALCETPISQSWPQTCTFTPNGREYFGVVGVTKTNMTCKNWGSTGYSGSWRFFPEWYTSIAACRNPDPSVISTSPWCYRTDNNQPEACDVPMCPETDWASGQIYTDAGRPYAAITYNAAQTDKYYWTTELATASANPLCSLRMSDWCPYYYRGSCYMIFTLPNNHNEAQTICSNNGWHLTAITTRDEQLFVMGIINRLGMQWVVDQDYSYHIGLQGNAQLGYTWDNGEPFSLSFWQGGQPNGGGETCAFLWTYAADGYWADYYCWYRTWFICEIKLGV